MYGQVVEKVVQGVQKAGQVRESRALRDAELPGGHRALPATRGSQPPLLPPAARAGLYL